MSETPTDNSTALTKWFCSQGLTLAQAAVFARGIHGIAENLRHSWAQTPIDVQVAVTQEDYEAEIWNDHLAKLAKQVARCTRVPPDRADIVAALERTGVILPGTADRLRKGEWKGRGITNCPDL